MGLRSFARSQGSLQVGVSDDAVRGVSQLALHLLKGCSQDWRGQDLQRRFPRGVLNNSLHDA